MFGQPLFVFELDGGELLEHRFIGGIPFELLELGHIPQPAFADRLIEQVGQAGVGLVEPPAGGDAVGNVLEFVRGELIVILEHTVLDDLRMQLGYAVDAVGRDHRKVGHPHLEIVNNTHPVDVILIVGFLAQVLAEPAVDLTDNLVDSGQQVAEDVLVPLLKRLGHDRVVGIGKGAGNNVPRLVPAEPAVIKQHPHQLGDCKRGMGVVDLDGVLCAKVVKGAIEGDVPADDI